MIVKVRVTVIRSKSPVKNQVIEGHMAEVPQIGRAFKVTDVRDSQIRVVQSTKVTRILAEFPSTVWVDTELTLFRIEILQGSDRQNSSFIRWIPFLKRN